MKKIVILGAGPAGLSMAYRLLKRKKPALDVVIIDRQPDIGGLAASFMQDGLVFDYGSHRLHPATNMDILKDLGTLLGTELAQRPRNGRIRLMGRYVRFPLTLADSLFYLPPAFMAGIAVDVFKKLFCRRSGEMRSFADFLLSGLGPTICRAFYFPYAQKLWGLKPEEISVDHARQRVSQNTIPKIVGKIFRMVPGMRRQGAGTFFYPRRGFGRICKALVASIVQNGGRFLLSTEVETVRQLADGSFEIRMASAGRTLAADYLIATIPITDLVQVLRPVPGPTVAAAAAALRYRSMVLLYLVLDTDRFTPFDAYYFPENNISFSRVSEPQNYSDGPRQPGKTGLCVEIPCWEGDNTWNASDEVIAADVVKGFERCGLPRPVRVTNAFTRRLSHAYPVYNLDYARHLKTIDSYLKDIPNLIRYGRQALFIHDNLHHALEMGAAAASCLEVDGSWNDVRWRDCIRQFESFTVED